MPRNSTALSKGIGPVEGVAGPKPGVYAPPAYYVRAKGPNKGLIDGLEAALGLAEKVAEVQYEKDANAGAVDAAAGAVDEDKARRSAAYRRAVETSRGEAEYQKQAEAIAADVEQAVENGETIEEIDERIKRAHAQFIYDEEGKLKNGFDDPEVARVVLPQLQKRRAELVAAAQARIKQRTEEGVVADADKLLDAEYDESLKAAPPGTVTGKIDVLKLNARLAPVFGGRTNALMLQMLGNLAIERGDPELLNNLPDAWPNGAPTFARLPQFADDLERYRDAAVKAGEQAETAAAKAEKARQAKVDDTFADKVTTLALQGKPISGLLIEAEGKVSAELRRTLFTFQKSVSTELEQGAVNASGVAAWSARVFGTPNEVTVAGLMKAYNDGEFGTGTKALEKYTGLVEDLRVQQDRVNNDARFRSDVYDKNQAILRAVYLPPAQAGVPQDADAVTYHALVARTYADKVAAGKSYAEAMEETKKEFPLIPGTDLGDTARRLGFTSGGEAPPVDPATFKADLGRLKPEDMAKAYGGRAEEVKALVTAGKVSQDDYIKYLTTLPTNAP